MKFKERLLQGILIKRYKRFFIDIKYKNKIITAHCPNSGSMMGMLNAGNKVLFSESKNPKRKLKYTLQIIEVNKNLIGINTHLTNKIVFEALKEKKIKNLIKFKNIKSEVNFSSNTRFDFLISNNKEKCFLEIKNVTLSREKRIAEFPDAITSRGSKHLKTLIDAIKKGYKYYTIFLVQIQVIEYFKIAKDIDKDYYQNYLIAKKAGVNFLAYRCKISPKEIRVEKKIKIIDE